MYCLQTVKNCSNNNFFCSNNKKCKNEQFLLPRYLKKIIPSLPKQPKRVNYV